MKTVLMLVLFALSLPAVAEIRRESHAGGGNFIRIEVLTDELLHVEYGAGQPPKGGQKIARTIMLCDESESFLRKSKACGPKPTGPRSFKAETAEGVRVIQTAHLRIELNLSDLAMTVFRKVPGQVSAAVLTRLEPQNLNQDWKGLSATKAMNQDYYGLGQQFSDHMMKESSFRWNGRVREGGPYGNVMSGFNGGANGNTQIPVLYALGTPSAHSYAMFLDSQYRQKWDFRNAPPSGTEQSWKVETFGRGVRFYFMAGTDPLAIRRTYMSLVGKPPVPPRKMFGMWMSEYGYDNWNEVDAKLTGLRAKGFPLDGFVLDLQWFGGIKACTDDTRMGSLSWDTSVFPRPADRLRQYRDKEGLGFIAIEEAYIGKSLPEHKALADRGCLVRKCPNCEEPVYLDDEKQCWWGKGGMLDFTDSACADFWHDYRRRALVKDGVIGHWTDLGEPEVYKPQSGYKAGSQADAHNLYNLLWTQSVFRGLQRDKNAIRPFVLTRSGTAGSQRYGAAMWSGDIGSRLSSLAAHFANQANMSLSGIDYYGSDIGGFYRKNAEGDVNEMYTQWFAYGMLFDIPGRPHTANNDCTPKAPEKCFETSPAAVGHVESNLANARLRYRLIPYLYSLAHVAHETAEPVFPPLLLHYPDDPIVRDLANEKMIGRDLLVAPVARHGQKRRDVYLPKGTWLDLHTDEVIPSQGQWVRDVAVYSESGVLRLPMYLRQGALVPTTELPTSANTNTNSDTIAENLTVLVFPTATGQSESFYLYEDDGRTTDYLSGRIRRTRLTQQATKDGGLEIKVGPGKGTFAAASKTRTVEVQLAGETGYKRIALNGKPLAKAESPDKLASLQTGWALMGSPTPRLRIKLGAVPTGQELRLDLQR